MTWTETKSYSDNKRKLEEALKYVEDRLSVIFNEVEISDSLKKRKCFVLDDGVTIHIESMNGEKFCDLVVEYADNINQMRDYDTEDGDLFPVGGDSAYESLEALFQDMLKEIGNGI